MLLRACVLALFLAVTTTGPAQSAGSGRTRTSSQSQTNSSQTSSLPGSSQSSTATVDPFELSGRVINARTNAPVPRALVKFGQRAVLTNHDGIFSFPQVTNASGVLEPSKPGFYSDPAGNGGGQHTRTFIPGAPVTLLLYPEAVIPGCRGECGRRGPAGICGRPASQYLRRKRASLESGRNRANRQQRCLPPDRAVRRTTPCRRARSQDPTETERSIFPSPCPRIARTCAMSFTSTVATRFPSISGPRRARHTSSPSPARGDGGRGVPRITAYNASGLAIPLSPVPGAGGPGNLSAFSSRTEPTGSPPACNRAMAQSRETLRSPLPVKTYPVSCCIPISPPDFPSRSSWNPGVSIDNLTIPTARSLGLTLISKVSNSDGIRTELPRRHGSKPVVRVRRTERQLPAPDALSRAMVLHWSRLRGHQPSYRQPPCRSRLRRTNGESQNLEPHSVCNRNRNHRWPTRPGIHLHGGDLCLTHSCRPHPRKHRWHLQSSVHCAGKLPCHRHRREADG